MLLKSPKDYLFISFSITKKIERHRLKKKIVDFSFSFTADLSG
jgi:hypothetical protein